jgi:uncharacterized protein (DUF488 family)
MTRNTKSGVTRLITSPYTEAAPSRSSTDSLTFFTIGHSNRSLESFIALLRESDIDLLIDIRTVPRSHANPQFNGDVLSAALTACRIDYRYMPTLGGLRGRQRDVPEDLNAFWHNASFHNYADYALSKEFRGAIADLRELGRTHTAIMCAEVLWWRCHRRIVTDYLLAAGDTVFHILGPGKIAPASMTVAARQVAPGTLTYPAD